MASLSSFRLRASTRLLELRVDSRQIFVGLEDDWWPKGDRHTYDIP
jgi:hypothetical protein